ncbi:PstS family phosphate ABC transporter substrate-binding protein [bacterium]|nr:PstS family phosphate ABC transporter substrate-binding protein [bacterium]
MKKSLTRFIVFFAILSITGLFFSSNSYSQSVLQIKGSDTLINLVQRMAEVYMNKNPDKMIAVTGGGSGTGIAALINGKCDIANASRLMKDKEIAQAKEAGVDPRMVIIALDGLSVITNASNPVNKLTVDEIGKIFRGEITNWKALGGKDMPITLYGRQSNSGTFIFFMEEILKGDYSPKMNRMNGNSQIVESIKQDVSGIGYVGVGYLKEAKGITAIKVASEYGGYYSSPLDFSDLINGKYPIIRSLNQYVNGSPKGFTREFVTFELSEEGQKIVEEEGFLPIPDKYVEMNKNNVGI